MLFRSGAFGEPRRDYSEIEDKYLCCSLLGVLRARVKGSKAGRYGILGGQEASERVVNNKQTQT